MPPLVEVDLAFCPQALLLKHPQYLNISFSSLIQTWDHKSMSHLVFQMFSVLVYDIQAFSLFPPLKT